MKDVLQEAMDLEGLKQLLKDIQSGSIECLAVDTTIPSAFSHEILNSNPYAYLDDAPLEERRARAVSMRRVLPESLLSEVGRLDPAAIQQVVEQSWPDIRTADELHDALLTMIAFPVTEFSQSASSWQEFMQQLLLQRRTGIASHQGSEIWFAAEKFAILQSAYPNVTIRQMPAEIDCAQTSFEDAVWMIIRGWMPYCGPVSAIKLAERLQLPLEQVQQSLLRLESSGSILRGNFTDSLNGSTREIEWCDRRLLARIHRLTLGTLRKQIEPVTAAQFMRWLFRWHHVAPGTQVHGERGTFEVLRQLQGFESPAREWESHILASRVRDYQSGMLDKLCWSGAVGWGRFSSVSNSAASRRMIPGTAAPITFFLREDPDWVPISTDKNGNVAESLNLSPEASLVRESLRQRGASFLPDLVRYTKISKAQVEAALWELVTVGVVTADGFDSLRTLLDKRKARVIRRSGSGRWSLLYTEEPEMEREKSVEAACKMLLLRYGIVFRDVIQRETLLPRWRELLIAFRRMEDRGEVRGGRFVSGFVGEQFALPLAVDSLRAIRKIEPSGEIVSISPADPLNLVGLILPGERISAVLRTPIIFRDGVPVSTLESIPNLS